MVQRTRFLLSLILVPLALMLGCSDVTAPTSDEVATFFATVSGDASRVLSGRAVFTTDAAGPEYGFAIALVDSTSGGSEPTVRHAVYLYRDDEGPPALGKHTIGAESAFRVGIVLDGNGNDPRFCVADSGTVRLTSVTSAAIRGSFDVRASCFQLGDGLARDTILAAGTFRAVSGTLAVPDDVPTQPEIEGRFELRTAAGIPLPTPVFDGVVLVGEDEFIHLEITVTGGYIEFAGIGAYEHRVSQEVRVDGQPAPSLDWVDRGTCVASAQEVHCVSNLVANRFFTGALVDGALEVTQDLNGEGVAVAYRYVSAG